MPLLAGDRVRTQNGRVEILFADGSTLHLDTNTPVDFQSDEVIRLLDGRVRLNIVGAGGATRSVAYRVDAPSAWVQIARPGEYRISVLGAGNDARDRSRARGAARRGRSRQRRWPHVARRRRARVRPRGRGAVVRRTSSTRRRGTPSIAGRKAGATRAWACRRSTCPTTVQPYAATFNRLRLLAERADLRLRLVSARARRLAAVLLRALDDAAGRGAGPGLDRDPWAWPTHHYGRWGFSAGSWFWIPGRTWGPAWVSWAYAPGYVSWCPLGWNNRAGLRLLERQRVPRLPLRPVERVDGRAASRLRPRLRQRERRQLRRASTCERATRSSCAMPRRMSRGYAVPRRRAPIRSAGVRAAPSGDNGGRTADRVGAPGRERVGLAPTGDAARGVPQPPIVVGAVERQPATRRLRVSRGRCRSLPAPTRRESSRSRDAGARRLRRPAPHRRRTRARQRAGAPSRERSALGARRRVSLAVTTRAGVPGDAESYSPGTEQPAGRLPRGSAQRAARDRTSDVYAPPRPSDARPSARYRTPSQDAPERAPRGCRGRVA